MPVTAGINALDTVDLKPGFGISLRIQFNKLYLLIRYCGEKRDIMILVHRMIDGNIVFIFHDLFVYNVVGIGSFRFKRRKGYPAAAYQSFACCLYNVAAYRADIEFTLCNIGGLIAVANILAGQ